jgi:hypothetical protein
MLAADTRARSASTSDLPTSKRSDTSLLPNPFHIGTSKSMSGFGPGEASKDNKGKSGLSPFFGGKGESGRGADAPDSNLVVGGLKSIMSLSADAIKIVGDTLLKDSGIKVKVEGTEVGESTTDPDAATPLVKLDVDNATQVDMDAELGLASGHSHDLFPGSGGLFAEERARASKIKQGKDWSPSKTTPTDDDKSPSATGDASSQAPNIGALLAGGRRDSLNLEGGVGAFYPTLLKNTDNKESADVRTKGAGAPSKGTGVLSQSGDAADELVQQCADKLVAEILESATEQCRREGCGGEEGEERSQEERIGNITYLPVEENSNGDFVVLPSPLDPSPSDPFTTSAATQTPQGLRNRPSPLTVTKDESDGSGDGPGSEEGGTKHTSSESFSPLRSSAQHISNFVNYATGTTAWVYFVWLVKTCQA